MLKFAIIGTGKFANHHARTIQELENTKLVGFCSHIKERAENLAKEYNCKAFTDYKELLNSDVDIIVIVNKHHEHAKFAKQAIKANKHVLIEKPFAITKRDMNEILKLSKKHKVKAVSCLQFRYSPAYQKLKKLIESGKLGKINSIHLEVFRNKHYDGWKIKKEQGGGLLFWYLIHYLDILIYLFEEKPKKITAFLRKKGEVEDTANIVLSYKDFDITINSSYSVKYNKPINLTVNGEDASISVLDNRAITINKITKSKLRLARLLGILGMSLKNIKYFKSPTLSPLYEDLINSIKNNTEPETSINKTKDSLELIFKIKKC